MRILVQSFVGLLLSAAALSSWADQVVEKPVAADTPEKFVEVVDHIKKEMAPDGRYEFIRPDDKAKVEADFDAMKALLQKAGSVETMSQQDKVHLFNLQENANGILTHSDSNRLVCEHTAPVGTSIPRTTCRTVGELERSHKATKRQLDYEALYGSVCRDARGCRSN